MKMKKAIALLSGLVMTLPYTPCAAFAAEENTENEVSDTAEITEEANEDTEVQHLHPSPTSIQADIAVSTETENDDYELPSKFDLRTKGLVSSVKNQGGYGTCWAHAMLGSLETDRMAEDPHIDLSERYLGTYMVSEEYGDGSIEFGSGANAGDALGLLTNWIGAVSEAVAPYDEEYTSDLSRKELQKQSELHVTDAHCIDFYDHTTYERITGSDLFYANLNTVKRAICEGHAIYLSMHFSEDESYNYFNSAIYNESNYGSDHAVIIVGYDDDYSADNFNTSPGKNGAWLVKNSWGVDRGDNGFYWVSYYDNSIDEMQFFEEERAEMHDHLYSYDDCGVSGQFGISEDGDTCTYISNEYTAEENGFITDVMLNCCVPDDEYEITVYTGVTDADVPTSGEAHTATTGTLDHIGYQTITIAEPVHISEGETFAVVAKINGAQGYHIACEFSNNNHGEPLYNSDFNNNLTNSSMLVNEERIMKTFGDNQSFFSSDGQNWTDLYESYDYDSEYLTGNLCLRAMTCDEGAVHFSTYSDALAPGTEISLSCADGKDIYYSVDNGDYQLYTAPVSFQKDMTISAYAEGDEDNVFSKHYSEKHAEIINMLAISGSDKFYVDIDNGADIIIPVEADELTLLPTMTGTLTDGENVTGSYEERTYKCGAYPFSIKLTAQQEGLKPTEYTFNVKRECADSFTNGTWVLRNAAAWYYFYEDGRTGYCIDRITGERTDFSYSMADNELTVTSEGSVRKGMVTSNHNTASIIWDDKETDTLDLWYEGEEKAPFYSNPQLCEFAKKYITKATGKEPISVKASYERYEVIVNVKLENGKEINYHSYNGGLLCIDDNNNLIDLENVPQDTGVTSFRQGIWSVSNQSGFLYYIYFDANGKDCTVIDPYSDTKRPAQFSLVKDQLQITYDYGYTEKKLVTIWEDRAVTKDIHNMTTELEYISDATPETFNYLSNDKIMQLVSDYYEAMTCKRNKYIDMEITDGRYVILHYVDKPYYLDQMSIIPFYRIDRLTGECTDENGDIIDLYNPVMIESEHFAKGLWRCDDLSGTGSNGYFWFSGNNDTAVYYDAKFGTDLEFSYRFADGYGIAYINGGKVFFTAEEAEGGIMLSWADDDGCGHTLKLTYIKNTEKNSVKFYSYDQLEEMVLNDFIKKNGEGNYRAFAGSDFNGNVCVSIRDENAGEFVETYIVDPMDGTGHTENGEYVDFVQTKTTSICDMILNYFINSLIYWLDIISSLF